MAASAMHRGADHRDFVLERDRLEPCAPRRRNQMRSHARLVLTIRRARGYAFDFAEQDVCPNQ
eukprot:3497965-Rhodomonas_salina.1